MLDKIYEFKNYRTADAGDWIMEQYCDSDMTYTCHVFKDGSANVTVETNDKFAKLVACYDVDKEGNEICPKKAI